MSLAARDVRAVFVSDERAPRLDRSSANADGARTSRARDTPSTSPTGLALTGVRAGARETVD